MKFRSIFSALLCACLLAVIPAAAQDDQTLEEEFIRSRAELGESHASGARSDLGPVVIGNPTTAHKIIRVGLSYSYTPAGAYSEFNTRHWPVAEISHTVGLVYLRDQASGTVINLDVPGTIVRVTRDDATGYHVTIGGAEAGVFAGPLYFEPTDATNQFRLENIRRSYGTTQVPRYRGALLLANTAPTSANRFHVVNVVEIEDYVPGVVANESIASFHMEALKAQAVAARGYAIANIGRYIRDGFPYGIVDSTLSQVYRGVISEHPRAVQSSNETVGLVASYNGQIIGALYSSSFGGHSDSNHWIFNSPSSQLPGTNVTPYLTAIYDGEGTPLDLTDPAVHYNFWTTIQPQGYDMCGRVNNRFARWRITLTAAQIKSRLTVGRYVVISGNTSGSVTNVEPLLRMDGSGRIAKARITLTSGVVEVRGWDNMRFVLGRTAVTTPATCPNSVAIAANFTLTNPSVIEPTYDINGNFTGVISYGGGWGHNTGMSQYGAHGRGLAGQNFMQILKAYYTGVDIGSYPIDISRDPGSGPPTLRQSFYAANALGTLVVRSTGLKKLVVHINETHDIVLTEEQLSDPVFSLDISQYLVQGVNTIQYNPVGRDGNVTVNVVVD